MENLSKVFWETTYRQNIARMIGICYRYTQNRQTAEDLAHHAFLIAIDKAPGFQNKGPFEAWLRRIVINVALQHLRDQKKQLSFEKSGTYPIPGHDFQEEILGNEPIDFSEAELLEVISNLPEHHRLVFNLYVMDNFTHAQIGMELGISEGTSKSHLARARKKIRELLSDAVNKNNKRKRILFFILPLKIQNTDLLFSKKLHKLNIQPHNIPSFDTIDFNNISISRQPPLPSPEIYSKPNSVVYIIAASVVAVSILYLNLYKKNTANVKPVLDSMPIYLSTIDSGNSQANKLLFPDSTTATISDKTIITDENNKKSEKMKNVTALGVFLMSSLAFDSASLSSRLPVEINHQEIIANDVLKPMQLAANNKPVVGADSGNVYGSFYASKLFWSSVNNSIFLIGKNVKVDLNTQHFTGSGKFSFMNKINYLVFDGIPMELNGTKQLTEKKYNLIQLTASDAAKKYGDKGKYGVVEISLAE